MLNISDLFADAQPYLLLFNAFARKHSLAGNMQADHICYKCDSSEVFENIRAMLERESIFIYQSIISDRRIAYVHFKEGIRTELGTIWYLELSDQKQDGSQKNGFDHIEAYPITGTYEDQIGKLQQTEIVEHVERPHHTTDDIDIGSGFLFRASRGPLIKKIKNTEMGSFTKS